MLKYGNKEFRNLQEQVLKNAEDIAELMARPLLEIKFVEELPETGIAGVLYLVPMTNDDDDTDDNSYDEYIWTENGWELVGSTPVDISNMMTTDTQQEVSGEKILAPLSANGYKAITFKQPSSGTMSLTTDGDFGFNISEYNSVGALTNTLFSITKFNNRKAIMYGADLIPTSNTWNIGNTTFPIQEIVCKKYTIQSANYDISKDSSNNLYINAAGKPIVFGGIVQPLADGMYSLGKSNIRWTTVNTSKIANDYSNLTIKGNPGITLQMSADSAITPSNGSSYTIGTTSSRFKTLYLSHYIDWGNGALLNKDDSNRININYNSTPKVKVGNTETYFANHVEPDASNTYDLGRSAMYWRNAYITNIITGNGTSLATNDIVAKPNYANPDVFEEGTLNASGQGTIDMTQTGVPSDGLYMFTYGNCQCFLSLTSTMIQNASSYPIRCPCPTMYSGSAYPGILKIERSADLLTLTVATAGVGNVTPSGFEWKLIKVM